jgi:cellulose synthase/poly-beta-1,6-N-acetylglucosamine synthase-like glycosyltransferase
VRLRCASPPPPLAAAWRLPRRFKKYAGLDNYPPLQIMFATKGKNKGKLDSHCWYFDAFCYLLQPEYCVLFDAGGWWGRGCAVGLLRGSRKASLAHASVGSRSGP